MEELTLMQQLEWAQDPMQFCAGQPVIPAYNFEELAVNVAKFPEVTKTSDEVLALFQEEGKRYTACGANNDDRLMVMRRVPDTGWAPLAAKILAK